MANIVALEQTVPSPLNTVLSSPKGSDGVGSGHPFEEPFDRHLAGVNQKEDARRERKDIGYVHFRPESKVPDVGGLGWKTRTGHFLKNQAYYSSLPKTNKWDLPVHAGINTWKEWHGPRMRTDAQMMERLDHFDEEQDHWEAKKTFVNTMRVQTLDRFYNQKLNREQKEAQENWAPHRRARREVHDSHEHFFADMDAKPEKELRKVLTSKVLQRDRDAIRSIASRIQNEETWKAAWKQMEEERRHMIRTDLKQRQHYNDLLCHLSGQPVRASSSPPGPNNCTERTEELARPRGTPPLRDVTQQSDFRGLFHADCEHALEALFPGHGHELSVEFRERVTASAQAGWPPPPAAQTPRRPKKGANRELTMQQDAILSKHSVPVSAHRLQGVAARTHDEALKEHSKAQFLPKTAPPPPAQSKQLLREDWSPKTTLKDKGRTMGIDFRRTDQGSLPHSPSKGMEDLPPPRRQYTYPVMVGTSPKAKGAMEASLRQALDSVSVGSDEIVTSRGLTRNVSEAMSFASRGRRNKVSQAPTKAVCQELDTFESNMETMPRICNFFATPRKRGETMSGNRSRSEPSLLAAAP